MKTITGIRIASAITALSAAMTAMPAAAGGAVIVKGGAAILSDDTQLIDNRFATIDDASSARTFGLAFEHRTRRNGMSFGIEYNSYRHDFTTALAEPGETHTQILQFVARKYFFERSMVRPFIGVGVGGGYTRAEYTSGGLKEDDYVGSFVLQGVLGVEFRVENLSLMLEAKRFWHEPGGSDDYNATATGVYGGIGFNW